MFEDKETFKDKSEKKKAVSKKGKKREKRPVYKHLPQPTASNKMGHLAGLHFKGTVRLNSTQFLPSNREIMLGKSVLSPCCLELNIK